MRRPRVVAASLASAVFAIGLVASAEPPERTPDQLDELEDRPALSAEEALTWGLVHRAPAENVSRRPTPR